jgi:hypothetical protein
MIRIINQEEFKKCCEMCNSKDLESRYLGISLMNECVEHLNCPNLSCKMKGFNGGEALYNWDRYIEMGINSVCYNFGNELYELLLRGCHITPSGLKVTLIEHD